MKNIIKKSATKFIQSGQTTLFHALTASEAMPLLAIWSGCKAFALEGPHLSIDWFSSSCAKGIDRRWVKALERPF